MNPRVSSDVIARRARPATRARQLAGDALAGVFVGLVIVLGIALLWHP